MGRDLPELAVPIRAAEPAVRSNGNGAKAAAEAVGGAIAAAASGDPKSIRSTPCSTSVYALPRRRWRLA